MVEIHSYTWAGLTLLEVDGRPFTCFELWELVGKFDTVATFHFVEGSAAFEQLGPEVSGTINYTVEERIGMSPESNLDAVKIVPLRGGLSVDQSKRLKYRGVSIVDIRRVSFMPTNRVVERHDSGEKKVPNVITIPYKHDPTVNIDRLRKRYLVTKNNDGIKLIGYEKDVLVGLLLAENEGRIDSRILSYLGHDVKSAEASVDVRYARLSATQRRRALTHDEKHALEESEQIRYVHNVTAVLKEVAKSQLTPEEAPRARAVIGEIVEAVRRFEPAVLLHCNPQVYWDIDSYAHITLRHIKDFQVGRFREKTPFPYKVKDLRTLIEKVLRGLREEIEHHFKGPSAGPFTRHGAMSLFFNGDYYSVRIEPSGRLVAFYVRTDENEMVFNGS